MAIYVKISRKSVHSTVSISYIFFCTILVVCDVWTAHETLVKYKCKTVKYNQTHLAELGQACYKHFWSLSDIWCFLMDCLLEHKHSSFGLYKHVTWIDFVCKSASCFLGYAFMTLNFMPVPDDWVLRTCTIKFISLEEDAMMRFTPVPWRNPLIKLAWVLKVIWIIFMFEYYSIRLPMANHAYQNWAFCKQTPTPTTHTQHNTTLQHIGKRCILTGSTLHRFT